jgi:hypothetical protein
MLRRSQLTKIFPRQQDRRMSEALFDRLECVAKVRILIETIALIPYKRT